MRWGRGPSAFGDIRYFGRLGADGAPQDAYAEDNDNRRQIESDGAESKRRNIAAKCAEHRIGDHVQKAGDRGAEPLRIEREPAQDDPSEDSY